MSVTCVDHVVSMSVVVQRNLISHFNELWNLIKPTSICIQILYLYMYIPAQRATLNSKKKG